jgi:hypothetical protein
MTQRSLAALILVNAVLLAALTLTVMSPAPAQAQFGRGGNAYMMISGSVTGRENVDAIYIIDRDTSRMMAAVFDSRNEEFQPVGVRQIRQDIQQGDQRR